MRLVFNFAALRRIYNEGRKVAMNVLIAGSREVPLKEREDIYEDMRMVLSNLRERHEEIILVSGGARGIDRLGEEAAASLNIDIKQFLPS